MFSRTLPTLRWGIIATGAISTAFAEDLILQHPDAKAHHIIVAIGSSSQSKGEAFVAEHLPNLSPPPRVYEGYEAVYTDSNVDIVYIGTPNSFHKQNCLDAIKRAKHVLCEKAFTLNANEAEEVIEAAREKGVFVMEGMWTRFFPLTVHLQHLLHAEKVIGGVKRVFADFSQDHKLDDKGPESRLKSPALGAGSLLNLGVYSLTWGLLALDGGEEELEIKAIQTLSKGIDVASSVLLSYPATGQTAICTSSSLFKNPDRAFCRIEGSLGHITIHGNFASRPEYFVLYTPATGLKGKKFDFLNPGQGFYWEADAIAQCIDRGETECKTMSWKETVKVMRILDEVRRQGGAVFPSEV
jgi:predicted dehydrogenase